MENKISSTIIKKFLLSRIHNQQIEYSHPPYDYEQQLLDAIMLGSQKKAKEILTKINKLEAATLASSPIRSKKNSLIAICTLFTRAIIKGGVNPETAFNLSDAYIRELEKINDHYNLAELEYEMLYQFIETLKNDSSTKKFSHPITLAISYIHENILHDLSLELVAKQVFINPSYLSSKFKKEVGLTISDFINKQRIEESKYFLLNTNTTISDIALLFKFCNQSYYSALFKKYNGVTPGQFRLLGSKRENLQLV